MEREMNLPIQVTQEELSEILINIAPVRPVFIWGAPGIGKSALVEKFAKDVGMECVSLLGSQLAPEDIIGVPRIRDEVSEFLPPKMIAKKEPYVLFLDELNACSQEVQKAFYSLIYERRVGEYHLPDGSVVIGAGNRAQDSAIVKTMSSALINRMFHVQLKVDVKQWLDWAYDAGINPWVIDYINARPEHLFSQPSKSEEPFSTPRSWHMLSDLLTEYGFGKNSESDETETAVSPKLEGNSQAIKKQNELLRQLAYGCVSPNHAGMFVAFTKQLGNRNLLSEIIKGDRNWPSDPNDRDVLYFLAQSFRDRLLLELPEDKDKLDAKTKNLAFRAKAMMKDLSLINFELAQMVASDDGGKTLPDWFMVELVRDLPRLVQK